MVMVSGLGWIPVDTRFRDAQSQAQTPPSVFWCQSRGCSPIAKLLKYIGDFDNK